MELFDTHAHLDFPAFEKDRDKVLERAEKARVRFIVTIGSGDGIESTGRALDLARRYDRVWCTVGVHPHDARLMDEGHIEQLRRLAADPRVVAIGEIGLDYAKMHSPKEVQIKRFRDQLALARQCSMPVVIHDREAHRDMMKIIKQDGAGERTGIMHCFSGGPDLALELCNMGFFISIPGVVTFKNAKKLSKVVEAAPLDKLLIETDCPFLAPEPHRGKRNEPAYVRLVAQKIAKLRGESLEKIAEATTANAFRAYNIRP